MGGRLVDWLGQDDAASRPAAAGVAALTNAQGCVLYFANDTKILSIYDHTGPAWFDVDVVALSSVSFQTLSDVDWTTPPTDGQVFAWDVGSSLLVPITLLYNTSIELMDEVNANVVGGTGITTSYLAGVLTIDCDITQFTDENVMDAMNTAFAAGTHTGITITYDDALNKFDFAVTIPTYTDELAQDAVGTIISGTGLATATYNDGVPSIVVDVPAAAGSDFRTGTDATKALTSDAVWDAAAYVALNDSGGNIAVDLATGFNFTMTMDGDYTLSAPSNGKPGQTGSIILTQDGSGNQTLAYNAVWKFANGTDPVLSITAGAVDILFFQVLPNGTDVFASLQKATG